MEKKKSTEEKPPENTINEKIKDFPDKNSLKELDDLCQIKHALDLANTKINEKAINKILKEKPFIVPVILGKPKSEKEKEKESKKEEKKDSFDCCQYYMFPSGITKTSRKNFKTGEECDEKINYEGLDPKVYEKFKKNPTRELDILIGNTGYLFNSSPIMRTIVQKKISGYYLWDRMYIWQYYIKSLDDAEKIKLIRNFLYRLKLFFKKCYEELMNLDKIKYAYKILKKILNKVYEEKEWDEFYLSSKMLGYNPDGSINKNFKKNEKTSASVLLEDEIKLNIKNELNGTGAGLIFVKELRNFSNMFLYSKGIFEKVFADCFDLLSPDFKDGYIKLHCVIFKYFDMFILSHSFMAKMFSQLLLIYSTYKQDGLVNHLHKLLIPKFNAFDELEKLESIISSKIGNDIQYDEEKKIEKFETIDELVNYIENDTDKQHKKKKKKKKNNNNIKEINDNDPINKINEINKIHCEKKFGDEFYEDIYEGKEIPDNMSVMSGMSGMTGMSGISEADSIVRAFKNDVKNSNYSGEKVKANLSDSFVYNLDSNF